MTSSEHSISTSIRDVIRQIASRDASERDRGADEVTDILGSFSWDETLLVARLLVFARLNETSDEAGEAQLNALAELNAIHPLGAPVLDPLRSLGRLTGSQSEHLQELFSAPLRDSAAQPAGWPALIPRIAVDDPGSLVSFIQYVFAATGEFNGNRPTELRLGDSLLMVGSTIEREPMTASLYLYVEDTDSTYRRALERGAASLEEPRDMPYGDRRAMIRDSWGNTWQIATHRGEFTT